MPKERPYSLNTNHLLDLILIMVTFYINQNMKIFKINNIGIANASLFIKSQMNFSQNASTCTNIPLSRQLYFVIRTKSLT